MGFQELKSMTDFTQACGMYVPHRLASSCGKWKPMGGIDYAVNYLVWVCFQKWCVIHKHESHFLISIELELEELGPQNTTSETIELPAA